MQTLGYAGSHLSLAVGVGIGVVVGVMDCWVLGIGLETSWQPMRRVVANTKIAVRI